MLYNQKRKQPLEVNMDCMYHVVPDPMVGTMLYPLNQLKDIDRVIYESAAAKYYADPARNRRDRRALMRRKVPILNCLWNDVLHSSAVHPQNLMDMWRTAGYVPKRRLSMFEIPIEMLDREKVIIYKHQCDYLKWMRWNYARYDHETFATYTKISEKAKTTMKKLVAQRQIWHFMHISHVLYHGTIETSTLSTVTVDP